MMRLTVLVSVIMTVWLGSVPAWAQGPGVSTPESGARRLESPPAVERFTFAVFGDRVPGSDAGLEILSRAVRSAEHLGVRFVMTTGNMVDGARQRDEWERRVTSYRAVMDGLSAPWYPVRGPLDAAVRGSIDRDALYASRFGPSAYAFTVDWALVVALPSEELRGGEPGRGALIDWLKQELAGSEADQVFVLMHAPLWREVPDDWAEVHRVFVEDGRATRVISGGTRYAREDRQRDNVRYTSVSMTGAYASETHEYASSQAITLVHVTRRGHEITVLPYDAAASADAFDGDDADAVRALAETGWASIEGFLQAGAEPGDGAAFEVVLENPTDERIGYGVEVIAPEGWVLSRRGMSGTIAPGQTLRLPVAADAPALGGTRPEVRVLVTARYPVSTGGEQPVVSRLAVPMRPRGAEAAAGATPESNGVLSMNGRGAVRVDLGERPLETTVEAWVRSSEPTGNSVVASRYVDGAGIGIVWSRPRGTLPSGVVGTDRGTALAVLDEPIAWDEWHHVALTCDGNEAVLFVDGVPVGRGEAGEMVYRGGPFFVGAEPNGRGDPVSMFSGMIDEVRVSSVVRYRGAFTPARTHETDTDTVLLLHFDTAYHGAHPDDSGRGHHGWTEGSVSIVREPRE